MEKEITIFKGAVFWLSILLLALCSCRSADDRFRQQVIEGGRGFASLSETSPQALSHERDAIVKERKLLEMELEWLLLRQKFTGAEIDLRLAHESEIKLALEMSRFGEMEKRLPGDKGFIDPGQRIAWEARLAHRREETIKARTRIRLLQRDLRDLEGKFSHRGLEVPVFLDN